MEVALFVNRVTDYTAPVFRRLAAEVSLQVYTYNGEVPFGLAGESFQSVAPGGYTLSSAPCRLLDDRPDVVVAAGTNSGVTHLAGEIAARRGIPLVVWTDEWEATQTPRTRLLRPVKRRLVRMADAHLACGELQRAFLTELGANPETITVARYAPCTIPSERDWQPPPELDADQFAKQAPALYFGRLIERKGPLEVVRAAESSGTSLLVAGDGPLAAEVDRLATECPTVETLTRRLKDTEKAWLLAHAGVTCLPATAEPWGIVVIESLSVGTPVVASTEVAAAVEHIATGANGFLVAPRDCESIEQALDAQGRLPDNVAPIARATVADCTADRQASALVGAVETAVEQA